MTKDLFKKGYVTFRDLNQALQGVTGSQKYTYAFTNQRQVTVNHNLGKDLIVQVYDEEGNEIRSDITHINSNSFIAYLADDSLDPVTGKIVYF